MLTPPPALLSLLSLAGLAQAAVVPARVVLDANAVLRPGYAITVLNTPFTNPAGQVGFTGVMTDDALDTVAFVYAAGSVTFFDDSVTDFALDGAEVTSGVGVDGSWLYSPSIDGGDGIWSSAGKVIAGGEPAPGVAGRIVKALSRPTVSGAAIGAFVASTATEPATTTRRAFYRFTLGDPATLAPVLQTGQVVGGFTIANASPEVSFNYDLSDSGLHHVHRLGLLVAGVARDGVYLDGSIVLLEGDAISGSGFPESWSNFATMAVNDAGTYLVAGDTSTSPTLDNFVVHNGVIGIREKGTLDGIFLQTPAVAQAVSLDNLGRAAMLWSYDGNNGGGRRTLFYGPAAALASAQAVATGGDELDLDGDGLGDVLLVDLVANNGLSPGLDLADDGFVFVDADLAPLAGGPTYQAIIRLCASGDCPPDDTCGSTDFDGDGDEGTDADIEAFFAVIGGGTCPTGTCASIDFDGDGDEGTDADIEAFFRLLGGGPCQP